MNITCWKTIKDSPNQKVSEPKDADLLSISIDECDRDVASKVFKHLEFKGNLRTSKSGNSFVCYREPMKDEKVYEFDLNSLTA